MLLLPCGLALKRKDGQYAAVFRENAPVAGTEGGSGEMSGRQVPPGCALVETGRTLAGRWIRASATWGRALPGLREGGGSVGAAIRGRGAR